MPNRQGTVEGFCIATVDGQPVNTHISLSAVPGFVAWAVGEGQPPVACTDPGARAFVLALIDALSGAHPDRATSETHQTA